MGEVVFFDDMAHLVARIDQLEGQARTDSVYLRQMHGLWEFISAALQQFEDEASFAGFNLHGHQCDNCRRVIGFLSAVSDMMSRCERQGG